MSDHQSQSKVKNDPGSAKVKSDENNDGHDSNANETISQDGSAHEANSENKSDMIMEQERLLPTANINRIMRRVVPPEGKLSKEAKDAVQEAVSEFIQFVISEASDNCVQEKRKTITCEDLLRALKDLSFDPYVDILKLYIENYRAALNKGTANPQSLTLDQSKITPTRARNSDGDAHPPPSLTPQSNQEPPQFVFQSEQPQPANDGSSLEQVQVFIDSQTGQHYMAVADPQTGQERLVPVALNISQITTSHESQ
ncbi:unnamed protein product [Bursaphelenchus xylophilus]|uniref:(pine wood nematode) hypothetical protein n=1 Tax=Bursaphelenchus xylophilus TaxID=6326 RepID=A0A1I7SWS5_BURXY|nr:unnamed protein product [Bursaphelenchus xylophilus]CAG9099871.1 unnamed protein product [Bursaphelenchus xylophilus]